MTGFQKRSYYDALNRLTGPIKIQCSNCNNFKYFKMEFKRMEPRFKPEKDAPLKPDQDPDPTEHDDPTKNDPTRIEEPDKNDPTRKEEPVPLKPEKPFKKF
jgi:hypothetical protein